MASLAIRPSAGVIQAVQHIRRMRGGAQSHLMRAEDGGFYVVKFQNNPQHVRVLANELLATRLAERVGLPVPKTAIIEVSDWLIESTAELRMQVAGQKLPCVSGMQFGARFVVEPFRGQVFDYIPDSLLPSVRNLQDFAGMLCLDKWTCNSNGRQAVYWRKTRERKYTATFIDQGYCFNAGEWNFPDSPLRGVFARNDVYKDVTGWESFEPWLSRIQTMDPERVWDIMMTVPPIWCGSSSGMTELERVVETLIKRRSRVTELITDFRKSSRQPFPNWKEQI